ncbi:flagellar basal body-associated protein FliL [Ammonifex degensii KC4]|uniref:Flagellar protein FliL n=1 Tax=Ammonifex degensii (strain DSM 10501 / KC4) TaxID=429009 RepID=C9R9Y5_AMMDK|nr:flagellar basal body-associated FliL family protein [Ammonifex degensii]ACX53114.1 flagellar basal body-associated protein FliL [Ammonifex degensii KC4]
MAEKGKKSKLVLILLLLLVLAGVSGGGIFLGVKLAGGKKPAQPPPPPPLKTVSLDSIVVNLADGDTNHYLRVTVVLAVPADEKLAKEIEGKKFELRDLIIQLLRHKTFAEVMKPDYPTKLKEELKQKINAYLGGDKVKEIYFTEYLAQ